MSTDSLEKTRRQRALLDILRSEEIGSQEALRLALKRRRFAVTQATLSRDLKEMRIPCVPTDKGYRYEVPADEESLASPVVPAPMRMQSVAALEVTGIAANEVCVIVRTLTGRAQGVAVYIDGLRLPDVMATIAGDDTILVLPRSVRRTPALEKELSGILGLIDETGSQGSRGHGQRARHRKSVL